MQIIFRTTHEVATFAIKSSDLFPTAPNKCPCKDCHAPIKLKKHGYYKRYCHSKHFSGVIFIRRYICPVCGRTVSMLPMFCLPHFQYAGLDIIEMLREIYLGGRSIKSLAMQFQNIFPYIERRHLNFYRRRIENNRKFIQYGLNLIAPGLIRLGAIQENQTWVKGFLEEINNLHPHVFFVEFHTTTNKSFMTLQNILA